ncbi:MAG TPA: alpha/beta hydrolase [Steroidobacteraceae bacterium]
MRNAQVMYALIGALLFGVSTASAENWHDPSPHLIRFVTVQPGVKIETLDWGGAGRPVILIAGAGGTAHAFDDFALLLTPRFHVYGVTRRGYGDSSRPRSGYGVDRLGDDVVAVIHKLEIPKPILIGHSFGGQEVSDVAARYPTLIAAAIYLDAMYTYDANADKQALYWNVEWKQQIVVLQKDLAELLKSPFDSRPLATALRDRDLPAVQKIAENLLRVEKGRPQWIDPQPADLESFPALREWYHRITRQYLPEAEFRQMQAKRPDGRPSSKTRAPDWVDTAILAGRKAFHHILVPALYIGAEDNIPGDYDKNDPAARANAEAYIAYQHGWIERRTAHFTSDAPNGRLVILQGANHMLFASNPQDVLRETLNFADSLPP